MAEASFELGTFSVLVQRATTELTNTNYRDDGELPLYTANDGCQLHQTHKQWRQQNKTAMAVITNVKQSC
jgi:hypothetical protein